MIKFPEMRKELIEYLVGLSNKKYQIDCWVKNQCPIGVENDELDYAIHFFFDDTALSKDPESMIGFCLNNEIEAKLIRTVCDSLNTLFDKYGTERSDSEYIDFEEWGSVIDSAKSALSIIDN